LALNNPKKLFKEELNEKNCSIASSIGSFQLRCLC
jgi:hypothetical protein